VSVREFSTMLPGDIKFNPTYVSVVVLGPGLDD
jgi:hypothetical protein